MFKPKRIPVLVDGLIYLVKPRFYRLRWMCNAAVNFGFIGFIGAIESVLIMWFADVIGLSISGRWPLAEIATVSAAAAG